MDARAERDRSDVQQRLHDIRSQCEPKVTGASSRVALRIQRAVNERGGGLAQQRGPIIELAHALRAMGFDIEQSGPVPEGGAVRCECCAFAGVRKVGQQDVPRDGVDGEVMNREHEATRTEPHNLHQLARVRIEPHLGGANFTRNRCGVPIDTTEARVGPHGTAWRDLQPVLLEPQPQGVVMIEHGLQSADQRFLFEVVWNRQDHRLTEATDGYTTRQQLGHERSGNDGTGIIGCRRRCHGRW